MSFLLLAERHNQLCERLNELMLSDNFKSLLSSTDSVYSSINSKEFNQLINELQLFQDNLTKDASRINTATHKMILDSAKDAFIQTDPYLDTEKGNKYEETIPLNQEDQKCQHLTLSEVLALLSLLFSIYFGIISSLPDNQIECIIAQNETIIEQQADMLKLSKENEDLRDTLKSLENSINILTNEIEILCNQEKDFGNPPEINSNLDAENTHDENGD